MKREKAGKALSERVAALEKQVEALARLTANHVANPPTLLVGWSEISRYCRKRPRTLSRYAKDLGFPAFRFGRHVVASPHTISNWLITRELARNREKQRLGENPAESLSDDELKAKLEELDVKLKG